MVKLSIVGVLDVLFTAWNIACGVGTAVKNILKPFTSDVVVWDNKYVFSGVVSVSIHLGACLDKMGFQTDEVYMTVEWIVGSRQVQTNM